MGPVARVDIRVRDTNSQGCPLFALAIEIMQLLLGDILIFVISRWALGNISVLYLRIIYLGFYLSL